MEIEKEIGTEMKLFAKSKARLRDEAVAAVEAAKSVMPMRRGAQ
jgi:hypothetical protein